MLNTRSVRVRALMSAMTLTLGCGAAMADNCNNVPAQQVYDCALKSRDAADKDLNAVYKQVMAAQDDDVAQTRLKAAERVWLQFRDAQCTFELTIYEGGKIYTEVNNLCVAQLTRDRTHQLQRYLACQKNPAKCAE